MNYRKAQIKDAEAVTNIVQRTKAEIYPNYYPKEVVNFFGQIHCYEHVVRDIQKNAVFLLEIDGVPVGTGCYEENHITRVYVLPEFQGKGYGKYILKELEKEIAEKYDYIYLDASLPACRFYEKSGYQTIRHEEWACNNGAVLVYDVMEKKLG